MTPTFICIHIINLWDILKINYKNVPSVLVCTSYPSTQEREKAGGSAGPAQLRSCLFLKQQHSSHSKSKANFSTPTQNPPQASHFLPNKRQRQTDEHGGNAYGASY